MRFAPADRFWALVYTHLTNKTSRDIWGRNEYSFLRNEGVKKRAGDRGPVTEDGGRGFKGHFSPRPSGRTARYRFPRGNSAGQADTIPRENAAGQADTKEGGGGGKR